MARLTEEEKKRIEQLYKEGVGGTTIAKMMGKGASTIYAHLERTNTIKESPKKTEPEIVQAEAKPEFKKIRTEQRYENPVRRGEIYYINRGFNDRGELVEAGRPAIIVSNNRFNVCSDKIEVVYLTSRPKRDMPTHVTLRSTGIVSTALCEQIYTISKERIRQYCGVCTDDEMALIDMALSISLALNPDQESMRIADSYEPPIDEVEEEEDEKEEQIEEAYISEAEYRAVVFERDHYKKLYDDLLERILKR